VRILLTGSEGYVGSALKRHLHDAGHDVIGLDLAWFGGEPDYRMDVRELGSLGAIDAIIHLAAIANDPTTNEWPRLAWETSVLATQQLCQAALRDDGCKRFIYASSVSVYGADRGLVRETDELRPYSEYNKVKMCAERVLLSYADRINVQIVRPATVCGLSPRMRLDLSVNMLTMQALTKGVITLHGGAQMRPSIHIDDMTDLYLFLLENPHIAGTYNAGFENLSLREIAEKVRAQVPCDINVTEQRDARSYQVNSDKLLATGFRPKKTIDHAIVEIAAAYERCVLKDEQRFYNLNWMRKIGVKDE
jgi:nucleoside-diphosphate-sugar epimerase